MGPRDLRAAAATVGELLAQVPDPAAPVPRVGGDVRAVVQHIADCLLWYAHDLVAGATESPGPEPQWPADLTLDQLTRELGLAAEVLARVVAQAGPEERGWHPWGVADPAGFAAIGTAELVLHGDDVATALDLAWRPPDELAAGVRDRLFPDAPADGDPWAALRWAAGRADLPGRDRVTEWRYAMAPPGER